MLEHCIVCTDKNNFRRTVDDVRRINNYILNRINSYDLSIRLNKDEAVLYSKIRYEHKNTHFMCGCCHQVNKQELIHEEDNLKKIFILSIREINKMEDGALKQNIIYDILRSLQGHYPIMHHTFKIYFNLY